MPEQRHKNDHAKDVPRECQYEMIEVGRNFHPLRQISFSPWSGLLVTCGQGRRLKVSVDESFLDPRKTSRRSSSRRPPIDWASLLWSGPLGHRARTQKFLKMLSLLHLNYIYNEITLCVWVSVQSDSNYSVIHCCDWEQAITLGRRLEHTPSTYIYGIST